MIIPQSREADDSEYAGPSEGGRIQLTEKIASGYFGQHFELHLEGLACGLSSRGHFSTRRMGRKTRFVLFRMADSQDWAAILMLDEKRMHPA